MKLFHERGHGFLGGDDHENGVVSGDRADDLGKIRRVDRFGSRVGAAAERLDHDDVFCGLDAEDRLAQDLAETFADRRVRHPALGVAASAGRAGMFDQLQLLDVPGHGGLRDVEAGLAQLFREPLLRIDLMRIDQFKDLLVSGVSHMFLLTA